MPAVGMIVEKPTSTRCVVQVLGETDIFSTTPGSRYFIGLDGKPTATAPAALLGSIAILQVLGIAIGTSRFLLRLDNQFVLTHG